MIRTVPAVRRQLTPRGRQRREQLLAAASERFAAHGYHPTSVAELVAAVGVGKGVFYWYFSSKDELFSEILRHAHHDLRRRQQSAIADEPDPIRRIELGIRATVAWFDEHRDYLRLLELAAAEERFAPVLRESRDVAVTDTARHLKEAVVEGRIPDRDPEALAQALLGVVGQLTRVYLVQRDEPVEDVADVAVAFCLHGITGENERSS